MQFAQCIDKDPLGIIVALRCVALKVSKIGNIRWIARDHLDLSRRFKRNWKRFNGPVVVIAPGLVRAFNSPAWMRTPQDTGPHRADLRWLDSGRQADRHR
jgi:hypothetical protein